MMKRVRSPVMTNTQAPDGGQMQSRRWWKVVLGAIVTLLVIVVLGVAVFGRDDMGVPHTQTPVPAKQHPGVWRRKRPNHAVIYARRLGGGQMNA